MEREHGREIDAAQRVVRPGQGRRPDTAGLLRGGDVHNDTEVEMLVVEARDDAVGRLADDRKEADHISRAFAVLEQMS